MVMALEPGTALCSSETIGFLGRGAMTEESGAQDSKLGRERTAAC